MYLSIINRLQHPRKGGVAAGYLLISIYDTNTKSCLFKLPFVFVCLCVYVFMI